MNIGQLDGVKLGNAVLMNEQLIGRIINITENSSIVQIITDSGFEVPVIIINKNIQGLAVARHSGNLLELDYLSNKLDFADSSIAVTSGEGEAMPYGLYTGKTIMKDNRYYINVHLESFYDIVSVLIDNK